MNVSRTSKIWVSQHPLISFIVMAYAWSWTFWFLTALSPQSLQGQLCLYVGVFGPALASALLTMVKYGSLRDWALNLVYWRVPSKWYLFALGFPMLFALTVTSEYALLGNSINISLLAARLPNYLPTLAFTFFLGGGNEEPGWRGFALPQLQTRFGPIRGTLLLGLAWALWHLPLLAASPGATHNLSSLTALVVMALVTLFSIILYAFWYTWLYNRTRSILLCILLHAGFNASNALLILLPESEVQGIAYQTLLLLSVGTLLISVIVLIAVSRGQLGLKANDSCKGDRHQLMFRLPAREGSGSLRKWT